MQSGRRVNARPGAFLCDGRGKARVARSKIHRSFTMSNAHECRLSREPTHLWRRDRRIKTARSSSSDFTCVNGFHAARWPLPNQTNVSRINSCRQTCRIIVDDLRRSTTTHLPHEYRQFRGFSSLSATERALLRSEQPAQTPPNAHAGFFEHPNDFNRGAFLCAISSSIWFPL